MRLIDANLLLKDIERSREKNPHGDSKIRANHTIEHDHIAHLVLEQPVAYDVDKVMEQLEEERDYCYKEMEKEKEKTDYFSEHIFEEQHNRGMAYNKAIEIVKSRGRNN